MPLYRYYCTECEEEFESRHSYSKPLTLCINCQGDSISRLLDHPINRIRSAVTKNKRVGDEVKEAIKEAKEELATQKEEIKKNNQ